MQIDSSTEVGYLHAIAFILEAASMANEPSAKPTLISHKLCPYVQRVAIALAEKSLPFIRVDIDLAAKPDWFLAISPLGKTPVLKIGDAAIFESAVILEYLEDMCSPPLHPTDPLERADHRAWIEVSSSILNDIAGFYAAATPEIFAARTNALNDKFGYVERRLSKDPYFAGPKFSLVDSAFAPVFRYFDVFDTIADFGILEGKPKTAKWRQALRERPSVQVGAASDYATRLRAFLLTRNSRLSHLMRMAA
jgi:glutathione S-transferase